MSASSGPDSRRGRTDDARDASEEAFAGGRWRPRRAWGGDPAVADAAVRRVVVVGDIHNLASVLQGALRVADRERCDALVQVGDFWLQDCSWGTRPRTHAERYPSLSWPPLMRLAMRAPVPVVVLDGNHEAWPCLTAYAQRPDVAAARLVGRPLHLGGSLWWADRGSTWTWGGARCGALGGAVSPDKWMPALAGTRWAEDEKPAAGDLARLCANAPGGLDVLFCHDAPAGVRGLRSGLQWEIPARIAAEAAYVRRLLRAAVDRTEPRLVFHGHWHQQNHERIRGGATEVFGLADGAEAWSDCAAVLRTAPLRAGYLPGEGH